MKTGVLPYEMIRALMDDNFVAGVPTEYINPASLDLPLAEVAYRVEGVFLPQKGETIRSLLPMVGATRHDLRAPLEVGVPYLIKIDGDIVLPDSVYAYANPKSSTGRINLFCRVVADGVAMYDALTPAGWSGEVWVLVRADSFPVLLSPGQAVTQIRFFDGMSFLDPIEMDGAIRKDGIMYRPDGQRLQPHELKRHKDSMFLTLSLQPGVVGWKCRGVKRILDFGKLNHYTPQEFFEPVKVNEDRMLHLWPGSFYILSTTEHLLIPKYMAAELRAADPRFGELRVHAAGFVDPGWGCTGSVGRPITLEVTTHEPLLMRDGQNVARIRFERMKEPPVVLYDQGPSNYIGQRAAQLSKHFKK